MQTLCPSVCCAAPSVRSIHRKLKPKGCNFVRGTLDSTAYTRTEKDSTLLHDVNDVRPVLVVLGSEVGGRWNEGALCLTRGLVRVRASWAAPPLRQAGAQCGDSAQQPKSGPPASPRGSSGAQSLAAALVGGRMGTCKGQAQKPVLTPLQSNVLKGPWSSELKLLKARVPK